MATQLDDFVRRVREYTGHDSVHVVSLSLGVTGVRYWLETRERHDWVTKFVGLAGANHGSSRAKRLDKAKPKLRFGPTRTNWFLNPENMDDPTHPLRKLNENETPGDINYYTLRGSDDRFFKENPKSPELAGAENKVIDANHAELLTDKETLNTIYDWLHTQ
jgi:triacylglycerol esterase/lipase EstA (alpha/beta hydrolase family)